MTRKFFFCCPLRIGNLVFGYIVLMISIAVIAYNLFELGMNVKPEEEFNNKNEKFANWENLESLFGQKKSTLVAIVTLIYYLSYVTIATFLLIFTIIFIIGTHQANHCLVSTFFVYSFFHLFFTVCLIVWEATSAGYIELGLILLSDVLLVICLFGVKYLIEAIRTGHIYTRPGEILSHGYY